MVRQNIMAEEHGGFWILVTSWWSGSGEKEKEKNRGRSQGQDIPFIGTYFLYLGTTS
jgi:hypothetical protein